jgi:hypothetical protein
VSQHECRAFSVSLVSRVFVSCVWKDLFGSLLSLCAITSMRYPHGVIEENEYGDPTNVSVHVLTRFFTRKVVVVTIDDAQRGRSEATRAN